MEFWKKKGAKFEDFVAYVYQSLLEINNCSSVVSKRARVKGVDGLEGEIDVYYEFEHLNLTYRVAIECKDWKTPVTAKEVRDFYGKIKILNNVAGVMISASGYQSGAKDWASKLGIILMDKDELPSFNEILARKFEKVFLPDERALGEPFWTLMELQNGKVTGTYFSISDKNEILLLISKKTAEAFRELLPDKERWCIRGISQYQLNALVTFAENNMCKVLFCPIPVEDGKITTVEIGLDILKKHYLWNKA